MRWKDFLLSALLLLSLLSLMFPLNAGLYEVPPISSRGQIKSVDVTFILRYEWIGSMKTAGDVDRFVAEHSWGNAILLSDTSDGILSIISYTGYNSTKNWRELKSSPTYAELKTVIDRFHYHGWKVIYSPGNTPSKWGDPWIWDYLTLSHPELIFMDGNGERVGVEKSGVATLIPNFFSKYSTPDTERGINAGARLIDVYSERLKQMILDGAFEWDGWFGVDGWNGLTQTFGGQAYFWLWRTDQLFGRWIGTNNVANWFDCSYQSLDEWGNSSYVPVGFPPAGWQSMNNTERGAWVRSNANLEWWYYWQDRFAQMYAQIRQVFIDTRPPEWYVGTILSQDTSSTWADNGHNNPVGMENLTFFAKRHSFDHYYIDSEWWGNIELLGRRQAYVAALVKSKIPEAHSIAGLSLFTWTPKPNVFPPWVWKQMYLSQIQTYAWKNGTRYRAVDPTWVLVWTPRNTTWSDEKMNGQKMAEWVKSMVSLMKNVEPVWLGPVDVLPVYHRGSGLGYSSVNFTFAQFSDVMNIRYHPEYITSGWETIFLDAVRDYGFGAKGTFSKILDLFTMGDLNVLYHGYGDDAEFDNTIFDGEGKVESLATFHLTDPGSGTSTLLKVLNSSEITDPYARWIASGYFGDSFVTNEAGALGYADQFIPIITYEDGFVELGLFYNSTSGRFFYGRTWSQTSINPSVIVPRAIINRGIYWVSESPINSTEPLLDLKVFKLNDGTLIIPMMNLKNSPNNWTSSPDLVSIISFNSTQLSLGDPSNYFVYWQIDSNNISFSSWSQVPITLKDGADILVIRPKSV